MSNLYPKGDRRAIMILSTIVVIGITAIVLFGVKSPANDKDKVQTDSQPTTNATTSPAHSSDDGNQRQQDFYSGSNDSNDTAAGHQKAESIRFDPNTVDSTTLIRNGLRPYQAHAFLRYRAAGAVFRKPIDIARLNCLEDEDIDHLLPLIDIDKKYSERRTKYPIGASYEASSKSSQGETYQHNSSLPLGEESEKSRQSKFTTLTPVDLNTADTTLLKRIPGIGSYTANKIVKARTQLGGYHSAQQLLALTNLSSDLLEWFVIDPTNLRHINLNTSTFNQLRQHPHIGYDHARDLARYIRLYGKIKDEQQLRSTNIFSDDELQLLLPYVEY